jgi:hypothetical protein
MTNSLPFSRIPPKEIRKVHGTVNVNSRQDYPISERSESMQAFTVEQLSIHPAPPDFTGGGILSVVNHRDSVIVSSRIRGCGYGFVPYVIFLRKVLDMG